MTYPLHCIAEAATRLGEDDDAVIVNLQGDEPFIPHTLSPTSTHYAIADEIGDVETITFEGRNSEIMRLRSFPQGAIAAS